MKNATIQSVTETVLRSVIKCGVQDFCISPGGRNSSFVAALRLEDKLNSYYFYDERCSASFALGLAQAKQKPVVICTTSGTATAQLFGAMMEGYYMGIPLIAITADRPRRFRMSNAPQSCEQKNLYGLYSPMALDIAEGEECDLAAWDRRSPLHINVCLEEPDPKEFPISPLQHLEEEIPATYTLPHFDTMHKKLDAFLSTAVHPFIIVGGLKQAYREAVAQFLLHIQAPVYLEAISGLREDPRLQHLAITRAHGILKQASHAGYPVDGILRIGGVPTFRLWRDLETMQETMKVLSLNDRPFSGLSWQKPGIELPLDQFFQSYELVRHYASSTALKWLSADKAYRKNLYSLLNEEPYSEASLVHALSNQIAVDSLIYLGNGLPIREWDLAATHAPKQFHMHATRGLNGIDGQTSIFFGLCSTQHDNWAILGDLTTLYDLSAPWILPQLASSSINIAVLNNGGGKIFERMFPQKEIQNCHSICLEPVARLWNLDYEEWSKVPKDLSRNRNRLIEIVPDNLASQRFWDKLETL